MLVGVAGAESEPAWSNGEIPREYAIRGFHGATLVLDSVEKTGAILTDVLGFCEVGREGALTRFAASDEAKGGLIDLKEKRGLMKGRQGRGSVHHIAFRAADDTQQAMMVEKLKSAHGMHPTEQKNRNPGEDDTPNMILLPRAADELKIPFAASGGMADAQPGRCAVDGRGRHQHGYAVHRHQGSAGS